MVPDFLGLACIHRLLFQLYISFFFLTMTAREGLPRPYFRDRESWNLAFVLSAFYAYFCHFWYHERGKCELRRSGVCQSLQHYENMVLIWRETIWLKMRVSGHTFLSTLLTAQSQILISDNTEKLTIEEKCIPCLLSKNYAMWLSEPFRVLKSRWWIYERIGCGLRTRAVGGLGWTVDHCSRGLRFPWVRVSCSTWLAWALPQSFSVHRFDKAQGTSRALPLESSESQQWPALRQQAVFTPSL